MIFSLLLVMLLGQGPAAPPVPSLAEAVQLADEGRDSDALAAFQARAAANPADHQARLWIARLHERMGDMDLAEAVYRSVLLEDASNVEAMAGVGRTLLARDEPAEALEVLERAEQLAPQNSEVLTVIGQAHRLAGSSATGIVYLERAYAASPTVQQRMIFDDARRAYGHRIEMRGFNEQFNGSIPDSNGGDLRVNVRLRDTLRLTARGQVQRKLTVRDERGGAGVEWRVHPYTTFFGQALIGPDNLVLPEGDFLGGVAYSAPRALWVLDVRYFDFQGAWETFVAPSVTWSATNRLSLAAGYALSITEANTFAQRTYGQSGFLRGSYRLYPRVSIAATYAFGVDDFDTFSIDQIGDFRANAVSGGVRVDFPTLTSLIATYERQWREQSVVMGRVTFSLAQGF